MFKLPQLAYACDALEPYVNARTMELHHAKTTRAYVAKLNETRQVAPELAGKPLEHLLANLSSVPEYP